MLRPCRPALLPLLVLGVLALGCDQPAKSPSTETKTAPSTETKTAPSTETKTVPSTETKTVPPEPTTPTEPGTPPSAPGSEASGFEVTSFVLAMQKERPWIAGTAEVKLGRDGGEFESLDFKAVCRIGDAIHVETSTIYLGSQKQGSTIPLVVRLFGDLLYDEEPAPESCDFWLSSRVRALHDGGRYQEQLLASRCLRGGAVLDHGCAPLPSVEGVPLTASSLDISILRPKVIAREEGDYELHIVVELTSKVAVAPTWKLDGTFECLVEGKLVKHGDDVLATGLHELSPGQKSRHFGNPEGLDAAPQQCEIVITGTARQEDPSVPMGTWCYRASEPIRVGPCPTAGT